MQILFTGQLLSLEGHESGIWEWRGGIACSLNIMPPSRTCIAELQIGYLVHGYYPSKVVH